jgi:DNA-binding NtrC family response regulator
MSLPTALIVDDDEDFRVSLALLVEREGFLCRHAGSLRDALLSVEQEQPDVVLLDMQLPDGSALDALQEHERLAASQVVVVTGHASVETAVDALRRGAADYLPKPVDRGRLTACLKGVVRTRSLHRRVDGLRGELRRLGRFDSMVGRSQVMQSVFDLIDRVAPTEASVLISGESGVGKELVAQAIHRLSGRGDGPLLALNCGAVPANLIESELFGHERGSFTGAERRRDGSLHACRGGTLFLDELTEMPPELQVKLLRVLETRAFTRVGGTETLRLDARVLAATNQEPETAVAARRLREDLYYRLNVFPIRVPALRERHDDVLLIAEHFLDELNAEHGTARRWNPAALDGLRRRRWPGNVRELRNVVSRAYIMSDGDLGPDAVAEDGPRHAGTSASRANASGTGSSETDAARKGGPGTGAAGTIEVAIGSRIRDVEQRLIESTLAQLGGDKAATAAALGISVKTLYNRLNLYAAGRAEG